MKGTNFNAGRHEMYVQCTAVARSSFIRQNPDVENRVFGIPLCPDSCFFRIPSSAVFLVTVS